MTMDDEIHQQKELFEFEKPKKSFPRLSIFFPKAELAGKSVLVLTREKIVFAAIGIIMLVVAVYAIGVEKGRTAGKTAGTISVALPKELQPQPSRILPPTPSSQGPQSVPAMAIEPKSVTMESTAIKIKTIDIKRPYAIIAATFSNKDTAVREAKGMKKDGFDASVIPADKYFQVCIGAYTTRDSAQNALKKVRQKYKDAYIKMR